MNKIGFSEFGRVYVPIDIKPINAVTMLPVRFKVDTGADTSTISKPRYKFLPNQEIHEIIL